MLIEKEIKEPMKQQRLEQYKKRYFELELDRIALIANGDNVGASEVAIRMQAVEVAYIAVDSIVIE